MNTHYKINGQALELANAFGFLYPAEVFLIQAIAQSLPDDAVLVNIGAGVGTGSLAMAEIHPKARMYTVDISTGGPNGGLENEQIAFARAGLPCPIQILGDSQKVWSKWKKVGGGDMIDLLFIDGDHSAAALEKDIEGWIPFVKVGGYALFHDYGSPFWGDVTRVVDSMIVNQSGWETVLAVDTLIAIRRGKAHHK